MFYKTVQLETMIYSLSFVSFFWKILHLLNMMFFM